MKSFFSVVLLTLFGVVSYAQQKQDTFTIEPKVGINVSKLTHANLLPGLVAGVESTYQITDLVGISAGVLFSMQGGKYKGDDLTFQGDIMLDSSTFRMEYINIPVTAQCYIVKGLALKAGTQIGFNIYDRLKGDLGGGDYFEYNYTKEYRKVDFSIPVGISYEIKRIVLDARYNIGTTMISKWDKRYNSVLQLTIGYRFGV